MLEKTGFLGRAYLVMEWITRLAYLNIVWIAFTVMGLVVFGIGPATVSAFAVSRKWIKGETDFQLLPLFWNTYKEEFLKANLLVWPLLLAGAILYIDYQYLFFFEGVVFFLLLFVFVQMTIAYILVMLYVFPLYVTYRRKTFQYYKAALSLGFSSPFTSLTMFISLLGMGVLLERYPGLLPFFSVSTIALALMWFSDRTFGKVKKG